MHYYYYTSERFNAGTTERFNAGTDAALMEADAALMEATIKLSLMRAMADIEATEHGAGDPRRPPARRLVREASLFLLRHMVLHIAAPDHHRLLSR